MAVVFLTTVALPSGKCVDVVLLVVFVLVVLVVLSVVLVVVVKLRKRFI